MTFVPYKGTGPAMNDLLGGTVDLMCEQATNSTPQIESNKVRAYGVTSAQRSKVPALIGAHTCREGCPASTSRCGTACTTARHAAEVIEKINAALRTALKDPELIKRKRGARHHGRDRRAARACRTQGVFRKRGRPVDEDHPGRGRTARSPPIGRSLSSASASNHSPRSERGNLIGRPRHRKKHLVGVLAQQRGPPLQLCGWMRG